MDYLYFAIGFWLVGFMFSITSFSGNKHKLLPVISSTSYLISMVLFSFLLTIWSMLASFSCLFLSINQYRLFKPKDDFTLTKSQRSFTYIHIVAISLIIVGIMFDYSISRFGVTPTLSLFSLIGLFGGIVFLAMTVKNTVKYRFKEKKIKEDYQTHELPTVSVLLPARNEHHAVADAVENLLQIDYPKLEIIVLDDESNDDTPEIIKSYAHKGVRFVEGGPLKSGWIGKNHALSRLHEEASGELLFFSDVDLRISPKSITKLVSLYLSKDLKAISILPKKRGFDLLPNLLPNLKNNFILGSTYPNIQDYPPTSSFCWLIESKTLNDLGGFSKLKDEIRPLHDLAKDLIDKEQYYFILPSHAFDITVRKKFSSLSESRIREIYPLLSGRLELIFAMYGLALLVIVLPITSALAAFSLGMESVVTISLATLSMYTLGNLITNYFTNPTNWAFAMINFVPSAILELILLTISFAKYEFGTVTWKSRELPSKQILESAYSTEPRLY